MTECCDNHNHDHGGAAQGDLAQHHGQDVVCVDDVSFSYQDSLVLERITLHVERGTTLGIIGPNGSGKTTLLKIMLGLLRPDSGYVQILGLGPQQACASGSLVGYVPQRHTLDLQFPVSARQVVELGAVGGRGVGGRPTEADRRRAEQLLASVGMSDAAETPIGELSGGQQQRVFVARAWWPGRRCFSWTSR